MKYIRRIKKNLGAFISAWSFIALFGFFGYFFFFTENTVLCEDKILGFGFIWFWVFISLGVILDIIFHEPIDE